MMRMHDPHETDTERKLRNVISAQREMILNVLEPALQWYASSPEPEIAEQALRKLQEMRG